MSALLLAVLIAGDAGVFRNDISQDEYVTFLNSNANPRMDFDCRFYDKAGNGYNVVFSQTGGYAFLKDGYTPGIREYTVGKSPTLTELELDEAGVFKSASMPPIYDASIEGELVRFRTQDGNTFTTIEYMASTFSGPMVVSAMTNPPPPVSMAASTAEKPNRYSAEIYDRRPTQLVGFCNVTQQQQPELSFEEFERFAREGS